MTAVTNESLPVEQLSFTEASRELDAIVNFFEQREVDVDVLVGRSGTGDRAHRRARSSAAPDPGPGRGAGAPARRAGRRGREREETRWVTTTDGDRLYFRQLLSGRDFARGDMMARQMVNFVYLIGDRRRVRRSSWTPPTPSRTCSTSWRPTACG